MHSKFLEFFDEECRARGIETNFNDDSRAEWRMCFRVNETAGIDVTVEITDESPDSETLIGLFTAHMMVLFPFMAADVAERYQAASIAAKQRLREYYEEAHRVAAELRRAYAEGVA